MGPVGVGPVGGGVGAVPDTQRPECLITALGASLEWGQKAGEAQSILCQFWATLISSEKVLSQM